MISLAQPATPSSPLFERLTRRRPLLIAPAVFAGLLAVSSRRTPEAAGSVDPNEEVEVVDFSDAGERKGTLRRKRVVKSEKAWRQQLSAEAFYVTRHGGTDLSYSGTYYQLHNDGLFRCIGCANALFSSKAKFDSGTGWPSFWAPIAPENVRTLDDTRLFVTRTEVRCKLCDAHLGHVFNDGPEPTGLRYCMNESALRFVPTAAPAPGA